MPVLPAKMDSPQSTPSCTLGSYAGSHRTTACKTTFVTNKKKNILADESNNTMHSQADIIIKMTKFPRLSKSTKLLYVLQFKNQL